MLPSRGRPGLTLLMSVKRELDAEDILRLAISDDLPRSAAPVLQRLRTSHHTAARYLASGKSIKETALLVDRTPQRIGDLTRDPAFCDLVAYYENQIKDSSIDNSQRIHEKLVEVAELATDEILDRLENDETRAKLPVGELRQIAALGLDRTVAPPKTAQPATIIPAQITFNMGTRDLRPTEEKIIEHEAKKPEEPVESE